MILLIKYKVDWELIFLRNQTKINKDSIRENNERVEHDFEKLSRRKLEIFIIANVKKNT